MIQEFKAFIMRGNVLDLAVGVIVAGAFGLIVNSLVNDILMPPIGMLLGGVDFSNLELVLKEGTPAVMSGETVVTPAVEKVSVRWGAFVNTIINFLIVAAAIFAVIKAYNRANPPAPAAEPGPSETDLLTEIRDLLKNR